MNLLTTVKFILTRKQVKRTIKQSKTKYSKFRDNNSRFCKFDDIEKPIN